MLCRSPQVVCCIAHCCDMWRDSGKPCAERWASHRTDVWGVTEASRQRGLQAAKSQTQGYNRIDFTLDDEFVMSLTASSMGGRTGIMKRACCKEQRRTE